jgi:hypothetical protein
MLAGNVVALLSPCLFIPLLTLFFGLDNYDFESMRAIRKGDDHDIAQEAHIDLELIPGEYVTADSEEVEQQKLTKAANIARITTVVMTLILLVLWPFPLYGTGYIFSKKFFTGWVSVGIIWMFFSAYVSSPLSSLFDLESMMVMLGGTGSAWVFTHCGKAAMQCCTRPNPSTSISPEDDPRPGKGASPTPWKGTRMAPPLMTRRLAINIKSLSLTSQHGMAGADWLMIRSCLVMSFFIIELNL